MIEFLQTLTAQEVFHYGGTWVSGIGSICAIVVALLLARRRRLGKPRLTVRRVTRNEVPYIRLEVVNLGEATTTITGIGWRLGFPFGRIPLTQIPDIVAGSDRLPKELGTGQMAVAYLPLAGEESWNDAIASNFGNGPIRCWVRSVRAEAYTADERTVRASLPPQLRENLAAVARPGRHQI